MGRKNAISFIASTLFAVALLICTAFTVAGQTVFSDTPILYKDGVFTFFGERYVILPQIKEFFALYLEACDNFWNTVIPRSVSLIIKEAADSFSAAIVYVVKGIIGIIRHLIYGNM